MFHHAAEDANTVVPCPNTNKIDRLNNPPCTDYPYTVGPYTENPCTAESYTDNPTTTNTVFKKTVYTKTRDTITTLLDSLMLVDSTAEDAIRALSSRITDYEDALMVETANSCNCDRIITRNKKDYKNSNVLVMTPAEFLKRNMQ